MGRLNDGLDTVKTWVMTLNRTFDTVTFWEAKNHEFYVLKGRIKAGEEKYLEGYLSPKLSIEEKEEIENIRKEAQSMYLSTLGLGIDDVD